MTAPKKKYPHAEHRQRLRERYLRGGIKALNDYEQLELLLTYARPFQDVKDIAKTLIKQFGSLGGVLNAEPDKLKEVKGVKDLSSVFLKLIRDIHSEVLLEGIKRREGMALRNSREVVQFLKSRIGGEPKETFFVLFLDNQNKLLECDAMHQGTVNQTAVYPREIFEKALRLRAVALIFAHNHPSGVLQPSAEDLRLNGHLTEAAKLFQMSVLDHLIVSTEGHYSFHEAGMI